jgi:hypothetical protein
MLNVSQVQEKISLWETFSTRVPKVQGELRLMINDCCDNPSMFMTWADYLDGSFCTLALDFAGVCSTKQTKLHITNEVA